MTMSASVQPPSFLSIDDDDRLHIERASVLDDIKRAWEHRWLALVLAVTVSSLGWYIVRAIPDTYEAKARVYLDTQSILGPLLKGLAIDNDLRQIKVAETTRKTLLRRPNLEKVARETDKDLEAKTPQDFERVLQKLADSIEVKGGRRDNIFVITCQDKDPRVAKKVVETLLSIFVESTLTSMRRDTGRTEKFLDEQIADYRARLESAETRLKEFKRKNVGRMPTEVGGYFSRLQTAMSELEQAKLGLNEAKKKRDVLRHQLHEAAPGLSHAVKASPVSGDVALIYERIARLEQTLDQLKLQYTDNHPDVQAVKRSLLELKGKLPKDAMPPRQGDTSGLAVLGQAYQELKVALGEAEAEVSALEVRVQEYQNRVDKLRQMMETIPEVEAELAQLNRDYEINKSNYESLVARRESASISREAEQTVDTVQFRIIDPPVVPALPTGPNRPLLLTLVLFLGLGSGGGAAWLKASMRRRINNQEDLLEVANGQGLILGSVPLVAAPRRRLRGRLASLVFYLLLSGLITVYALLMTKEIMHLSRVLDILQVF